MRTVFLFVAFFICLYNSSLAQKKENKQQTPNEQIKVNKEYDEKGNLIRYDSIYSYSWSGDTLKSFPKFPEGFGLPDDFMEHFGFGFPFENDSLRRGPSIRDFFGGGFDFPFDNEPIHPNDSIIKQFWEPDHFSFSFKNDSSLIFGNDSSAMMPKDWGSFFNFRFGNPDDKHNIAPPGFFQDDFFTRMEEFMRKQMEEFNSTFGDPQGESNDKSNADKKSQEL